ncbi:MAG: hypothetical protein AB2792_20095 [Candidatus Thiodiazotropha sp.]
MITKYLARRSAFGKLIEPVQVEKETDKSVWINGRRSAKRSDYENYFDSFDDAKAYMTKYAEDALAAARRRLEEVQRFAGNVKDLREP